MQIVALLKGARNLDCSCQLRCNLESDEPDSTYQRCSEDQGELTSSGAIDSVLCCHVDRHVSQKHQVSCNYINSFDKYIRISDWYLRCLARADKDMEL